MLFRSNLGIIKGDRVDLILEGGGHEAVTVEGDGTDRALRVASLTEHHIAAILVDAAISEEKAEAFQSCCNERFGAGVTLNPLNLIDSGRFEVKTANATIFVAPEQSYLLETRVIDGRNYLTILVEEEIEVNGFGVRTWGEKQG